MADVEENKRIALRLIDAIMRFDADEALGMMTDDVLFESPGKSPIAGVKTKAQVAKEFPALREVVPNGIKHTIRTITADGDRVIVEFSGESQTFDGQEYNNSYCHVMEIRDGMVHEFRDYIDHDLSMRVLGSALAKWGALQADRDREALEASGQAG